jgi:hypothetical protein
LQSYVRTADLDQVYAAAGQAVARANVTGMKLEAFNYYYIPSKDVGLAGIVARPTPELLKLQEDVIAAVGNVHREERNLRRVRHHSRRTDHRPGLD